MLVTRVVLTSSVSIVGGQVPRASRTRGPEPLGSGPGA